MATIFDLKQLDVTKRYTYGDYRTWRFDEMVELIRGRIVSMSPAPSRAHQETSGEVFRQLANHLSGKKCKVYHAPFDVRLPSLQNAQNDEETDTVVQPDICVVCDPNKLDDRGCNGAPDWIIEILSPATSKKDSTEKFHLYEQAGVKVYWIIHPTDQTVLAYQLNEENKYASVRTNPFVRGEKVPSSVLPNFELDLGRLFVVEG